MTLEIKREEDLTDLIKNLSSFKDSAGNGIFLGDGLTISITPFPGSREEPLKLTIGLQIFRDTQEAFSRKEALGVNSFEVLSGLWEILKSPRFKKGISPQGVTNDIAFWFQELNFRRDFTLGCWGIHGQGIGNDLGAVLRFFGEIAKNGKFSGFNLKTLFYGKSVLSDAKLCTFTFSAICGDGGASASQVEIAAFLSENLIKRNFLNWRIDFWRFPPYLKAGVPVDYGEIGIEIPSVEGGEVLELVKTFSSFSCGGINFVGKASPASLPAKGRMSFKLTVNNKPEIRIESK